MSSTTYRFAILLVGLAVVLTPCDSAAADRDDVLAAVQTFFDAMAAGDSTLAMTVLLPEGRFHSVREEDGKEVIRTFTNQESVDAWTSRSETFVERMWDAEARIHGPIATVWAPYDFHRDGVFSHCGVDIFTLVKTEDGWKISGGVYTVERRNCVPSPLGPLVGE